MVFLWFSYGFWHNQRVDRFQLPHRAPVAQAQRHDPHRPKGGNTMAGAREISAAWRGLGVWWMFDGVCLDFLMDLLDGFVWWIFLMDSFWWILFDGIFMGIRSWMTCLKMVWECWEGNFQTEMASKGDKSQTRTMVTPWLFIHWDRCWKTCPAWRRSR